MNVQSEEEGSQQPDPVFTLSRARSGLINRTLTLVDHMEGCWTMPSTHWSIEFYKATLK